jgi:catechol 2,3-dioxygenase-like lactoylglutathione lyase family enzyme
MGLQELPPAGRAGNFAPVRVNEQLTLDFMTVDEPAGLHLAFDVDPDTFDRILDRLRAAGVPFGNHPAHPDNGRIDHPLCPRGLFFTDEAGNLYEVMSPA